MTNPIFRRHDTKFGSGRVKARRGGILVTGGSGMVGSQILFGVHPSHSELDICSPESIARAFKKYRPKVVIHAAALTDMASCERNPEEAYRVNVLGTYHFARACRARGLRLVYLSTCTVFDGRKRSPYRETDVPHPLNVYGTTKWIGENIIRHIVPGALIIRTGWLFGGTKDKKFIKRFVFSLRNGKTIRATSNRFGSPTYVPDFVQALESLVERRVAGTYHVVNRGTASYYGVGQIIKKYGGFSGRVIPVPAASFGFGEGRRGRMEALVSNKLSLRSWQEALSDYIRILKRLAR